MCALSSTSKNKYNCIQVYMNGTSKAFTSQLSIGQRFQSTISKRPRSPAGNFVFEITSLNFAASRHVEKKIKDSSVKVTQPLKIGRARKEGSLPTNNFQVRTVSFREGKLINVHHDIGTLLPS